MVRAKLAKPSNYSKRRIQGMTKCGKPRCGLCPFIKEGREVKFGNNNTWNINSRVNCESTNCIHDRM